MRARTEFTNDVMILNENHFSRLMQEYSDYYNGDRGHLSLGRDSLLSREVDENQNP